MHLLNIFKCKICKCQKLCTNKSKCNPSNGPYTCLEGTSIEGCYSNPSFWPTVG